MKKELQMTKCAMYWKYLGVELLWQQMCHDHAAVADSATMAGEAWKSDDAFDTRKPHCQGNILECSLLHVWKYEAYLIASLVNSVRHSE